MISGFLKKRLKIRASRATALRNGGFTLIDMALALIVIGLLAAPALKTYDLWRVKKASGETQESLYTIKKAIADFYYQFDRYPCPADITLGDQDTNYGKEDCGMHQAAPGTVAGGVPFVTLKLPVDYSLDGWSNKITYVVTNAQTTAPMNPVGGIITVLAFNSPGPNQCSSSLISYAPGNAHFVLVSHGEDGVGAYNMQGQLVQPCSVGIFSVRESENCDYNTNTIFLHQTCAWSTDTTGKNYYDDLIEYQASIPTDIWAYTKANPKDISSNAGYIGINNRAPAAELDVVGNIKTEPDPADANKKGNVNADLFCAADGTDCMPSSKIGGFDPQMSCQTSGGAITGIAGNAASCNVLIKDPSLPDSLCPGSQVVHGISGGIVSCGP